MKKFFLIFCLFINMLQAREVGQTEITTEEGIEVYQKEKYYLLKKNVIILSDEFELSADLVKVYFDKDLYDVININSKGNVRLNSKKNLSASGENINFNVKNEDLIIFGKNCLLIYNQLKMIADDTIKVNNSSGEFLLKGNNSKLISEDTNITGSLIEGKFSKSKDQRGFEKLYVKDDEKINIKTKNLDMYALSANYDKKENTVELFENVKILRDNEFIEGDYAIINTLNESYKVTSKKSDKVKILLNKIDE